MRSTSLSKIPSFRHLSGSQVATSVMCQNCDNFSKTKNKDQSKCSRGWTRRKLFGLNVSLSLIGCSTSLFLKPTITYAASRSPIEQVNDIYGDQVDFSIIPKVLDNPKWPDKFPFRPEDFRRFDESPDSTFYESPRFVTHIDDPAISALTRYYEEVFPQSPDSCYLDVCSSWISHYPRDLKAKRVAGLGMNAQELSRNSVLTEFEVKDLNQDPMLPYEDNTFNVITNAVSVDYMTKPIELFKEMHRVLKPGGTAIMSFSNRCFPTKAIQIWGQTGDPDHVYIVGSYFHYALDDKGFEDPVCVDISPKAGFFGGSDPMYVVQSRKIT